MSVEASSDFSAAVPSSSFGPLRQIDAGLLNVGYVNIGPAEAPVVVLLHGSPYDIHSYIDVYPGLADIVAALWPERCIGLVSASGYLIVNLEANRKPLPKAEPGWWYQYYFSTERGRLGYSENRREFNKPIWQIASPKWDFDDGTFERTAAILEVGGGLP
jgi:hypothetical protein